MLFLRKFILFFLVVVIEQTYAQDTSYNELTTIVVSANKFKEKRIVTPIAITVLSPKNY